MSLETFLPARVELELPGASTTVELVSEYLHRLVHRGELGPGDRLPAERQLAVTLGIGRVTLRESLQQLEDEGYVDRRRGVTGGTFITDLATPFAAWRSRVLGSPGSLDELWDLREAVEVQVARLAAVRRTDADLSGIRETDDQLRTAVSRADFRRIDLQFHGLLAKAARSPRLEQLMYETRGQLFSPVERDVVAKRVVRAADGHATVIKAVVAGDPAAAEKRMREHLAHARSEMAAALQAS